LDKIVRFESVDSLGRCFAEAINISRRASGLEKIAGQLHPEVSAYLKTLKPDPKYQYVLMTPMGSFEFWGMNVNGDVFPDLSLSFDRNKDEPFSVIQSLEAKWLTPFGLKVPPGNYTNFGHKTFLEALRYRHHANKNPALDRAVDSLLDHWLVRRPMGPCHFGIGTLFLQMESRQATSENWAQPWPRSIARSGRAQPRKQRR